MDIYKETNIRIDFDKGMDITPIVVFEGIEMEDKAETFNTTTHQIEEVLNFVNEWEDSGCDVFV
jgi:hypothetical protein|tara:strand:- start:445 stop:636 length:192 start_codon:yes stop_codon:yes gene_type:complete